MVERAGLENRCARKGTVGSNPTLSAIKNYIVYKYQLDDVCAFVGAHLYTHLPD